MHVRFWSKKAVLTVYLPLLLNYVFHFKIGFEAFSLAINSITVLSARLKCVLLSNFCHCCSPQPLFLVKLINLLLWACFKTDECFLFVVLSNLSSFFPISILSSETKYKLSTPAAATQKNPPKSQTNKTKQVQQQYCLFSLWYWAYYTNTALAINITLS